MDLTIRERKFSFSAEYDIELPGGHYSARKAFFAFTDRIKLQDQSGNLLAQIRGSISPIRHRHDFLLADGRLFHFRCTKLLRRVFTCQQDLDAYTLYEHKDLRSSIFHQDRQVAAFTKKRITLFKGNTYEIRIDHDADLLPLLCLILSVNSSEQSSRENSALTINIGNLLEDRSFDPSWEPR